MATDVVVPLPVTLVTGFLGAGKSTYINRVLHAYSSHRIGLVVNEFGAVGLESNILETSPDDIIELSGGCMCCLLRKDLRDAVERLVRHDSRLDRIVVEASGLSDPVPVQQTFRNVRLGRPVQLESVICLVDQSKFLDHRVEYGVLDHQVRGADFVLITKSDESPESAAMVDQVLSELAPQVPRYRIGEEPPLELLVGTPAVSDPRLDSVASEFDTDLHGQHENDVQQLWFESTLPFDPEKLKLFFEALPKGIVRGKGVLYLANKDGRKHKFVLQLSGARREVQAVPWRRREEKTNVVLLLGKKFDVEQLRQKLQGCLADPGERSSKTTWKRT